MHPTIEAGQDLTSIGLLAAHVQHPVRVIQQTAEELNIKPALRLNGVAHYDAAQVERLTDRLRALNK